MKYEIRPYKAFGGQALLGGDVLKKFTASTSERAIARFKKYISDTKHNDDFRTKHIVLLDETAFIAYYTADGKQTHNSWNRVID